MSDTNPHPPIHRHPDAGWATTHEPWSAQTRVFIDTCSLMVGGADEALRAMLEPQLRRHRLKLVVATGVANEINRHLKHAERNDLARRGIGVLQRMQAEGLIDGRGEPDDPFPDNLFQSIFTRLRQEYTLILITQDRALAADILRLNSAGSVQGICGIHAVCIHGRAIHPWVLAGMSAPTAQPGRRRRKGGGQSAGAVAAARKKARVAPFALAAAPVALDATPVYTGAPVEQGGVVVDAQGRAHRLVERLGAGGEGTTWGTDTGLACKVYAPGLLTVGQVQKLKLMMTRRVEAPAICWPQALAHAADGQIVGYLMPRARGVELMRSVFVPPLLQQRFPDWDRVELVRVARATLAAIQQLHRMNVLLGDINPRNILVAGPDEVYIVDCDSVQVEGFPCPVGTPAFLPPDLHGVSLRDRLRTGDDERFALATLVFMILMLGKQPYAHQGGQDSGANVRRGVFPYPLGERGSQQVPPGPWQFMWSHLPYAIKEACHKVFEEDERFAVAQWLNLLARYEHGLMRGWHTRELRPTGFKMLSRQQAEEKGATWRACERCGEEFGAMWRDQHVCPTCARLERQQRERAATPPPPPPPVPDGRGGFTTQAPPPSPPPPHQAPQRPPRTPRPAAQQHQAPPPQPPPQQPQQPRTFWQWLSDLFS